MTRLGPALLLLAAAVTLNAAARLLWALGHLLPVLLVLATASIVVWALRRHRRPLPHRAPKVVRGHAEDAEVIRLRAEVEALRADLAGARADRADTSPADTRSRLLADSRSGAHPLGGER